MKNDFKETYPRLDMVEACVDTDTDKRRRVQLGNTRDGDLANVHLVANWGVSQSDGLLAELGHGATHNMVVLSARAAGVVAAARASLGQLDRDGRAIERQAPAHESKDGRAVLDLVHHAAVANGTAGARLGQVEHTRGNDDGVWATGLRVGMGRAQKSGQAGKTSKGGHRGWCRV